MSARLVLVEFMAVDRLHRAVAFPFIKGWASSRGLPSFWLRFGLRASVQFERAEEGIGLPAGDARSLAGRLLREGAAHVLFDRPPSRALMRLLSGQCPDADFRYFDDGSSGPRSSGALPCAPVSAEGLSPWLGVSGSGVSLRELFEIPAPDFAWAAGNEPAAGAQPLPFLVCGAPCHYSRPLGGNPCYRGLKLSAGGIATGCAFCVMPRRRERWRVPALELARRQLAAILKTHPPFPGRPMIRVLGEASFLVLDRFARMLKGLGFPPADFLFDARTDGLLRRQAMVRAALRSLGKTGHRIHLCLVGIENFSAAELERFNKGVRPVDNLAAVSLLLSWERDWPRHFALREHGGLSMIVFTPWTTLKDLAVNIGVFHHLRLGRLCGKLLTARLRLYPELPLARLAQRDGLLIPRYRDPALDTAGRNFYPGEMPWRFLHPELEAVNRVLTRLGHDDALASDALYARVRSWLRSLPEASREPLRAAQGVVLAACAAPRPRNAAGLLARTRSSMRRSAASVSAGDAVPRGWDWLRSLRKPGRGIVGRLEGLPARRLALFVADSRSYPNPHIYRKSGRELSDLFFGEDARAVAEAVSLTRRYEGKEGKRPGENARIIERLGRLLGYPPCCGRAFAKDGERGSAANGWAWLARRCALPGRIAAELHPMLLPHVPCSLDCAPSLRLVAAMVSGLEASQGALRVRTLLETLRDPYLVLLDPEGGDAFAQLIPRSGPGERFLYRPGLLLGRDRRLRQVAEGDEILLEPGCVSVLRRGREHGLFALNAFVWWWRECFHADYWRLCVSLLSFPPDPARRPARPAPQPAGPKPAPPPARPAACPEALRLRASLSPLLEAVSFRGYRVLDMLAWERPCLEVVLAKGTDRLRVLVEPASNARRYFVRTGEVAISYSGETPLDAPERIAAMRAFVLRMKGIFGD